MRSSCFGLVLSAVLLVDSAETFSIGQVVDSVKAAVAGGNSDLGATQEFDVGAYLQADQNSQDKPKRGFSQPNHGAGVQVADYSDHSLPIVTVGARVIDLFHGMHFDDILRDTPDDIRPPAVVAFYDSHNSACDNAWNELNFRKLAETKLPSRERLMVAKYNMYAAPRRAWYKFTPEMDLAKRFNVTSCPSIAFVPRSCNGWTEWCVQGKDPEDPNISIVGCDEFVEQCSGVKHWDGTGDWVDWVTDLVEKEGEPKISPFLRTYSEQGRWLRKRDFTTSNTHVRNVYMSQAFPGFTKNGFIAMETPKPVQDFMVNFHKENLKSRRKEFWDAESTQLSYHEVITQFVDMDAARHEKKRLANEYIKPVVEEWSKVPSLKLTSFYGIREYPEGSWLREHIDRIDTHVLSVTFSIAKHELKDDSKPWPLQVVRWNGDIVRYDHPPGTMVLYESSKLLHGRPFKNQGGVHLGAFVHFKPDTSSVAKAKAWDDIAKDAREHVKRNTVALAHLSVDSVEPKNPVFSEQSFGDNTRWSHDGDRNAKKSELIPVTFENRSNRLLAIFWKGPREVVLQGKVAPGASVNINSYIDHRFFWSEANDNKPVVDGMFVIEEGTRNYVYDVKPADAKPSKWKKVVEDKYATEAEIAEDERVERILHD